MPDESLEDKFDIEKQLALRRMKAVNRVLAGYILVVVLIFIALIISFYFFTEKPVLFIAPIIIVLIVNSVILFFFVIKPSDKASICLDLMNFLNQKYDSEMKMHIIKIAESSEEMECMDSSGKYPRMFMFYLDRPVKPFLNEVLKIPMYNSRPTGRLNIAVKMRDGFSRSGMIKKTGGMKEFTLGPSDCSAHEFWGREFAHDKERNFLIGSAYFGYRKGNQTISLLAENTDALLKDLKKIESGK